MTDSSKTTRVVKTMVACLVFTWLCGAALAQPDSFQLPPGCTLPFDKIATTPDPFIECGNCGGLEQARPGVTPDAKAKALQSQAKNNLCANTSQITTVDFTILRNMGTAVKSLQKPNLDTRAGLHSFFAVNGKKIGEGDVVRLKAWIMKAHVSDCTSSESGEAVNCNVKGFANNDLHIPLTDPTGNRIQDECSSITAEIIPHFRPSSWSELDLKTPVNNVVRITGTLFYDNAHVPCNPPFLKTAPANAKIGPPLRSTLWEIHPVYQLEVCTKTDASACDVESTDTSLWVAYDEWIANPSNASATQATGESQRTACPAAPANLNIQVNKCVADNTASPQKGKKKP